MAPEWVVQNLTEKPFPHRNMFNQPLRKSLMGSVPGLDAQSADP